MRLPTESLFRKERAVFLFLGCCSLIALDTLRLEVLLFKSMPVSHEPGLPRSVVEKIQTAAVDNGAKPDALVSDHQVTVEAVASRNADSDDARGAEPMVSSKGTTGDSKDHDSRTVVSAPESIGGNVNHKARPPEHPVDSTRLMQVTNTTREKHTPDYFTDRVSFEQLLQRENMVSVRTGCSIAAWTYEGPKWRPYRERFYNDCIHYNREFGLQGRDISPETASSLVKPGDTIYVEFKKIDHFVQETLPHIEVDFVLISGQNHLMPQKPQPMDYVFERQHFDAIVHNPHVIHWFLMNMDLYAHDPYHFKLSPFPYGLGTTGNHTPDTAQVGMNPVQAFQDELHNTDCCKKKNNTIFVGYFSMRTNRAKRRLVPIGPKLHPTEHFRQMHLSQYVVSPDGDRPDCYRHYEAIGLGAMPITQAHPHFYRHLAGNVIFNQTRWNLTELTATLPRNPQVNRRLVFEEYWMEYVERTVGRELRWRDPSRNVRCSLANITETVKNAQ